MDDTAAINAAISNGSRCVNRLRSRGILSAWHIFDFVVHVAILYDTAYRKSKRYASPDGNCWFYKTWSY